MIRLYHFPGEVLETGITPPLSFPALMIKLLERLQCYAAIQDPKLVPSITIRLLLCRS